MYAVLWGCLDPDFKAMQRDAATPIDAIKSILTAGEIDDLFIEIQKLSGYLRKTVADVKN